MLSILTINYGILPIIDTLFNIDSNSKLLWHDYVYNYNDKLYFAYDIYLDKNTWKNSLMDNLASRYDGYSPGLRYDTSGRLVINEIGMYFTQIPQDITYNNNTGQNIAQVSNTDDGTRVVYYVSENSQTYIDLSNNGVKLKKVSELVLTDTSFQNTLGYVAPKLPPPPVQPSSETITLPTLNDLLTAPTSVTVTNQNKNVMTLRDSTNTYFMLFIYGSLIILQKINNQFILIGGLYYDSSISSKATLQSDGNFVGYYNVNNVAYWNSQTQSWGNGTTLSFINGILTLTNGNNISPLSISNDSIQNIANIITNGTNNISKQLVQTYISNLNSILIKISPEEENVKIKGNTA